jgi:hypothetical protein
MDVVAPVDDATPAGKPGSGPLIIASALVASALRRLRFQATAGRTIRTLLGAAVALVSVACLSATAAESGKPTSEAVFKGHRLATFIDEQTHRATIEFDDRQVAVKESVATFGKITPVDLGASFLYFLHVKTIAGCGSYMVVRVFQVASPGKSEIISDFGACNSKLTTQVERRQGWTTWYAIAYRDDLATAQVALVHDDKLTTQEVKAPPCLFMPAAAADCISTLVAEASGSGELGV